jgi:hypothetical protein
VKSNYLFGYPPHILKTRKYFSSLSQTEAHMKNKKYIEISSERKIVLKLVEIFYVQ